MRLVHEEMAVSGILKGTAADSVSMGEDQESSLKALQHRLGEAIEELARHLSMSEVFEGSEAPGSAPVQSFLVTQLVDTAHRYLSLYQPTDLLMLLSGCCPRTKK